MQLIWLLQLGRIGVWVDGQAVPCMGRCMGGGDVDDVLGFFKCSVLLPENGGLGRGGPQTLSMGILSALKNISHPTRVLAKQIMLLNYTAANLLLLILSLVSSYMQVELSLSSNTK